MHTFLFVLWIGLWIGFVQGQVVQESGEMVVLFGLALSLHVGLLRAGGWPGSRPVFGEEAVQALWD